MATIKRKIDRKKTQDENIYVRILLCRAAINYYYILEIGQCCLTLPLKCLYAF